MDGGGRWWRGVRRCVLFSFVDCDDGGWECGREDEDDGEDGAGRGEARGGWVGEVGRAYGSTGIRTGKKGAHSIGREMINCGVRGFMLRDESL